MKKTATSKTKNTQLKPDLREAQRLLELGMKLVQLHHNSKRPRGNAWNAAENFVTSINAKATGYGLPLKANKLCSADPDNVELARVGLAALGFDLEQLLNAGVRTSSTRPGSGGRAAFADPGDVSWIKFNTKEHGQVLELRADSPNLQDCVPGVVYQVDGDEQLFTQDYVNGKTLDMAPALPAQLHEFWRRCSEDLEFLHEVQTTFANAIGATPGVKRATAVRSLSTGRRGEPQELAFDAPHTRTTFNEQVSVESILRKHGYTQHGQRWKGPKSKGSPGIREIPGKQGLWESDHGSDPLQGTFDAWSAFVQLDHDGDVEAAIEAWKVYLAGGGPDIDDSDSDTSSSTTKKATSEAEDAAQGPGQLHRLAASRGGRGAFRRRKEPHASFDRRQGPDLRSVQCEEGTRAQEDSGPPRLGPGPHV